MLTTWMLHQPDVLGETPSDNAPVAAIGDIGQTVVGTPLALDGFAVPDPAHASSLTYAWDFGDGATATGATTTHTYTQTGAYTLRLTVADAGGTRQISTPLNVTAAPAVQVPEWTRKLSGHPRANPAVTLPQPDDRRFTPSIVSQTPYGWLVLVPAVAIIAGIIVIAALRRQGQRRRGGGAATP
jgi:PKD domain